MASPSDRRYSASHEWHLLNDDGTVTIGISQHAIDELSDVTYLEITLTEGQVDAGESFGEIESVKATSEMYAGISGQVVEANTALNDDPEPINNDCYGGGWLIKLKPDNPADLDDLMDAAAYDAAN